MSLHPLPKRIDLVCIGTSGWTATVKWRSFKAQGTPVPQTYVVIPNTDTNLAIAPWYR